MPSIYKEASAYPIEAWIKVNLHDVDYMIVGGYALAFHGKPRHTGHLDIWINISETNADKLLLVLKEFGLSSLGFEKEDFLKPGYITQIGYPPLRIDILNSIDGIQFNEAVNNMQKMQVEHDFFINYIGLSDFITNKLASGRDQDLLDIKHIQKKQNVNKGVGKNKPG